VARVARFNIFLLIVIIACALGVVTSQHKARKLFVELQNEKELAQQMEVEWGKLQIEQSTLAMPARVEKLARQHLQMRMPPSDEIRYIRVNSSMVSQQ
jgi:cell division protein FtsL